MEEYGSLLPFRAKSVITFIGASQSGKTSLLRKVLENAEAMFDQNPHKIMYCYAIIQPQLLAMEKSVQGFSLHEGVPTIDDINAFADSNFNIIILDDLMHKLNSDIELLVTQFCNHKNLSTILLLQNMFYQGSKSMRTINLNTHYMCLMRSPRKDQIAHLAKQLFPGKTTFSIQAYDDCMTKPYCYILLDLHPTTTS